VLRSMAETWDALEARLRQLPGGSIKFQRGYKWDAQEGALEFILITGEAFDCCPVELSITVAPEGTRVAMLRALAVPEEVRALLEEVCSSTNLGTGLPSVRPLLLKLCAELYIDLTRELIAALKPIDKTSCEDAGDNVDDIVETDEEVVVGSSTPHRPTSPANVSRSSSRGSDFSMESDEYAMHQDEEELAAIEEGQELSLQERKRKFAEDYLPHSSASASVEDVLLWTTMIRNLQHLPGKHVVYRSSSAWTGNEGLVELALQVTKARPGSEVWTVIVVLVDPKKTQVQLKGAQIVPDDVKTKIANINSSEDLWQGLGSLHQAVAILTIMLCLDMDEEEQKHIDAMSTWSTSSDADKGLSALAAEGKAIDALTLQLSLIDSQIQFVETRITATTGTEDTSALQHELATLSRAKAEVLAERKAASAAIEAACLELTTAESTHGHAKVDIEICDLPSQSLRGHTTVVCSDFIQNELSNSGPWAHYAAYQFAAMLRREQELHGEFVCFYHSYSFAALLYEVQAEVARRLYGLPTDFAPLPRVDMEPFMVCTSLEMLHDHGCKEDHETSFRGVGLSVSCSMFAFGSEAPPLQCFRGGYSCTDLSFQGLLLSLLAKCKNESNKSQSVRDLAAKINEAARRNRVPALDGGSAELGGYMLQIFIHRSMVRQYAYPSEPYGVPIDDDMITYVDGHQIADGQARVYFNPTVFVDTSKTRLCHYCARPLQSCMDTSVNMSRGSFIQELRALLKPILEIPRDVLADRLGHRRNS